jgi:hypothetical protein
MLKHMSRSKLIVIWFSAVALIVVSMTAFGVTAIGTGALLLVMGLVPPLLAVMLWPTGGPPTIAEVIRSVQERG